MVSDGHNNFLPEWKQIENRAQWSLFIFVSSRISSSVCFRDVGLPVRHRVICKLTIYGRAKSQDVECAAPKTWIPAKGSLLKEERKKKKTLGRQTEWNMSFLVGLTCILTRPSAVPVMSLTRFALKWSPHNVEEQSEK